MLTGEPRVGRPRSSRAFSEAKDPSLYRSLIPSEPTPLGMVQGLPLPDPREGNTCYCWSHK